MNCYDLLSWAVFSHLHPPEGTRQALALLRQAWDQFEAMGYERPEGL